MASAAEDIAPGADLIVTTAAIVRQPERPLRRAHLKDAMVACAIDFDATLSEDLFEDASAFVVDDLAQYRYYRQQGYFAGYPADALELAEVLAGRLAATVRPGDLRPAGNRARGRGRGRRAEPPRGRRRPGPRAAALERATLMSGRGSGHMRIARSALLLALAAAALACEPAAATFPGRNGEIVLIEGSGGKYGTDGLYELLRFAPRLGQPTRRPVCGQLSYLAVRCDFLVGPAVSPDASRLAAFQFRSPTRSSPTIGPETYSLWILDRDGTRLESHPLDHFYTGLRWAPDGSALVAARNYYPSDNGDPIVVLNTDGSVRELVAENASQPDWCANGQILLVRYGEIRVVQPDGSLRRLTWRGGSAPSCSPHSRRVAFTRGGAIWTIPLAGGRARRLTNGYMPVWSPDGNQIAYLRDVLSSDGGVGETFVYRVGLRRVRVRKVSKAYVATDDPYGNERVMGIDWRPIPRN